MVWMQQKSFTFNKNKQIISQYDNKTLNRVKKFNLKKNLYHIPKILKLLQEEKNLQISCQYKIKVPIICYCLLLILQTSPQPY